MFSQVLVSLHGRNLKPVSHRKRECKIFSARVRKTTSGIEGETPDWTWVLKMMQGRGPMISTGEIRSVLAPGSTRKRPHGFM